MESAIALSLFATIVALDIWATARLVRDDIYEITQKIAQVIFVWLVPFLGALLVLYLMRKHLEPGSGAYSSQDNGGIDFDVSPNMRSATGRQSFVGGRGVDGDAPGD